MNLPARARWQATRWGLKATLVDGSYHPVDSLKWRLSWQPTLRIAGIPQANPVLLEPVGSLKAYVPSDNGDVMGILPRRGVLGMSPSEEETHMR